MKRLIVDIAHEEVARHHEVVRDAMADRAITDAEHLAITESHDRVDRVVALAKYRGQLGAALARDISTETYLSDLGLRAGFVFAEAA